MPWFGVTCKYCMRLRRKRHAEMLKHQGLYLHGATTAREHSDQLLRGSQFDDSRSGWMHGIG